MMAQIESKIKELDTNYTTLANELNNDNKDDIEALKGMLKTSIEEIKGLIPQETDLTDINERLLELENEPEDDTEYEVDILDIRNRFEALPQEEKLDKTAIRGLMDELARIEKKIDEAKLSSGSGGVSNLRIQQAFKYILKTETPSGLIDGSNTTYTVTQPIFAVLSFIISGETMAQLPNYTIKGNSIIFATALPSVYSGKDFEVKYI
jgi:hypothetical protein